MNVKILPSTPSGSVNAIVSKSDVHRKLICAALSDRELQMRVGISQDIKATIQCLSAFGAAFEQNGDIIRVTPISDNLNNALLDCGESGSTLRFILPVAAAKGLKAEFTGHGRLPKRPLKSLADELCKHNISFSAPTLPFKIDGRLTPGEYVIPGNESSQYISGLLFALPLLEGDSKICINGKLESKGYVDMTERTLKSFGIEIFEENGNYLVPGNQKFIAPKCLNTEGDWSNAAFFLAAGAIKGSVTLKGLDMDSCQPDKRIAQILGQFGANVVIEGDSVTVSHGKLNGIRVDVSEIPDLAPIIAVVGAASEGETVIYNAARLRMKESDRLSSVANMLKNIAAEVREESDALYIYGNGKLKGGVVDSFADHRIVMSAAVAGLVCESDLTITNAQAVEKSYPHFFEDYKRIGGKADVI